MFLWDDTTSKDVTHIALALAIEVGNLLCSCECVELFGGDVCKLAYLLGSTLVGFDLIAQEVEDFKQ